ncbi:MAG: hypothetical protein CM1200mP20_07290 [Pseudomonadota bacterium]|nr:MAG: hypothetical protein CM1200mP20_07290 [Pseudomonadota bacterium]
MNVNTNYNSEAEERAGVDERAHLARFLQRELACCKPGSTDGKEILIVVHQKLSNPGLVGQAWSSGGIHWTAGVHV